MAFRTNSQVWIFKRLIHINIFYFTRSMLIYGYQVWILVPNVYLKLPTEKVIVNKKLCNTIVGLFFLGLTSAVNAAWEGDTITASVDLPTLPPQYDGQMDWDNSTAVVSFSDPEFTLVQTNASSSADFSATTVTLTFSNTTNDSFNITYPEVDYLFESLDVGPYGISSLTLVDSDFSRAGQITSSFTSDSITLNMPMQNTNPGESFYATFEFVAADAPAAPAAPATAIPTMSVWALIMLSVLLGLVVAANRRRLF